MVNSNTTTGYTASNLPPGLAIDGATGLITGTPTTTGIYTVVLTLTNSTGSSTALLTITIGALPDPVILSALTAYGTLNVPFSYTTIATNNTTSYSASGLPAGLSINSSTGVISGTPTSVTTSPASVSVTATNTTGSTTAVISMQIFSTPPSASLQYGILHRFADGLVSNDGKIRSPFFKVLTGRFTV